MKSSRRDFLQISGLAIGAMGLPLRAAAQKGRSVSIIADPADPLPSSQPCAWAIQELTRAVAQHGLKVRRFVSAAEAPADSFCVIASGSRDQAFAEKLKQSGVTLSAEGESLALAPFSESKCRGLLACGDERGLMYALLEVADRVAHAEDPIAALDQPHAFAEHASNSVRSIGRIFASDVQDKPWFNDREMWPEYFSMLASQRFNRFSLNLGVGYDFLNHVLDAYFLFAYPFFLAVPGYNVRAINLPDEERDHNLEMLQFISLQAVTHGIDFQLGIWTHGYQWGPTSQPNYTIDGLSPEAHAAYSRDALTALLKACPAISGVTLRTHGESGVREGSYSFWSTVFSGIPACGRKVRLDLHTKGLDQNLITAALNTGMPVTLSPKYWAEHMGLPYHQAAIRELEMPHEERRGEEFFSLSSGSRSFTRYGYADFLRDDRPFEVMFRIWPGSHRLLLWGDPSSAAAHSRAFNFCGCNGVELFEPLSFKGRRGSGIPGSRCAYADDSLNPHWDWQKYLYTYRTWGRLMYNPEARPEIWQRYLRKEFGSGAAPMENALAAATPITEIITTAHLPSAANESFNPEYYTNQSIVDASKPSPYSDTSSPKIFGNVSPLDPQLFSTISEFVAEFLKEDVSGKYSPLEVAHWLDAAADGAESHLNEAEARTSDKNSPEFRRAALDLKIHIGIGRFFAAKLRAGVFYGVHDQSGDRSALDEAMKQYRRARDIWQNFAAQAKGIYVADITFGTSPHQRGHWLDRLPAIEDDIAELQKRMDSLSPTMGPKEVISLHDLDSPQKRETAKLRHNRPSSFAPGQPLEIALALSEPTPPGPQARLYYRHVNQSERWQSIDMLAANAAFNAKIPAAYTDSAFALQYYFEVRSSGSAWLFPGLGENLQTQPYFIVSRKPV